MLMAGAVTLRLAAEQRQLPGGTTLDPFTNQFHIVSKSENPHPRVSESSSDSPISRGNIRFFPLSNSAVRLAPLRCRTARAVTLPYGSRRNAAVRLAPLRCRTARAVTLPYGSRSNGAVRLASLRCLWPYGWLRYAAFGRCVFASAIPLVALAICPRALAKRLICR